MKTSIKFFALLLSTLALSGCASCPCEKNKEKVPVADTAKTVAAPVATQVAQKPAPVAPVISTKPAAGKIPAAVMK